MLLKDLIKQLQELYDKEVQGDYLEVFGEPEIMIDTFTNQGADCSNHLFEYVGFDKNIFIDRSGDGVYLILNRFSNDLPSN